MSMNNLKANILLTGHDQMVKVGKPALLEVKVEKKLISYWALNLENIKVVFQCNEQVIGNAATDSKGIASFYYTPLQIGVYTISYHIEMKKKRKIESRHGRLFVVSGQKPSLVVDIDGTISNYPDWKVPFCGGTAPIFDYANTCLQNLSAYYDIIYLTARDDALDRVTMNFLQKYEFPQGPVFYNDWHRFLKHPENFKHQTIIRLQESGVPVMAGVGDSISDIQAYLAANIAVFIRRGNFVNEHKQVVFFKDYRELVSNLVVLEV